MELRLPTAYNAERTVTQPDGPSVVRQDCYLPLNTGDSLRSDVGMEPGAVQGDNVVPAIEREPPPPYEGYETSPYQNGPYSRWMRRTPGEEAVRSVIKHTAIEQYKASYDSAKKLYNDLTKEYNAYTEFTAWNMANLCANICMRIDPTLFSSPEAFTQKVHNAQETMKQMETNIKNAEKALKGVGQARQSLDNLSHIYTSRRRLKEVEKMRTGLGKLDNDYRSAAVQIQRLANTFRLFDLPPYEPQQVAPAARPHLPAPLEVPHDPGWLSKAPGSSALSASAVPTEVGENQLPS